MTKPHKRRSPGGRPPVLVIDVGNTSTSLGLWVRPRITKSIRLPTAISSRTALALAVRAMAGGRRLAGAVLGSVVPAVDRQWVAALRGHQRDVRVVRVTDKLALGIPITYPEPGTIGADRLANACEAAHCYGAPVIVADFGTAVTFDVVSRDRGYIGGVIAPGLQLMFSYLAEKTALLPAVQPGPVSHSVGRSTEEAMRLGGIWGYRGLVREILKELKSGMNEKNIKVCATGGYAGWVLEGSGIRMPLDPDLTLRGLGRIFELNT